MTAVQEKPRTLFDKIWDAHVVAEEPGSPAIGIIPDPTTITTSAGPLPLCPATDQRGYASAPGPCDAGSVQTTGTAPGHRTRMPCRADGQSDRRSP